MRRNVVIRLPGSDNGTTDRMGPETERWLVELASYLLLAFEHGTVARV